MGCSEICGKVLSVLNFLAGLCVTIAGAIVLINSFRVTGTFDLFIYLFLVGIILLATGITMIVHEFKAIGWLSTFFKAYDTVWGRGCIYFVLGIFSLYGWAGWFTFLLGIYYMIAVCVPVFPRPSPLVASGAKMEDGGWPCAGKTAPAPSA